MLFILAEFSVTARSRVGTIIGNHETMHHSVDTLNLPRFRRIDEGQVGGSHVANCLRPDYPSILQ